MAFEVIFWLYQHNFTRKRKGKLKANTQNDKIKYKYVSAQYYQERKRNLERGKNWKFKKLCFAGMI
jgi:hypothetical protein